MHRDTKIGLALAILLIGFGGALCFPRHGAEDPIAIELEGTAELDRAIELLPVRAYTETHTTLPLQDVELTVSSESGGLDFPESPAFAPRDIHSLDVNQGPLPPSAPNPIVATALLPEQGGAAATKLQTKPALDEPELVYHVVKPGETLSGLASRYLGSVARYPEIFEANRDILETPDDLRLNMRLRIPAVNSIIVNKYREPVEPTSRIAADSGTNPSAASGSSGRIQ